MAILSRPAPPYCSGIPPPSNPSSPDFFNSSGMSPGFLFSSSFTSGKTSLTTNSSAVWPISFWSSVRSAGVKTSCGRGVSRRKLPPFAAGLVMVAVAMLGSLLRCLDWYFHPEFWHAPLRVVSNKRGWCCLFYSCAGRQVNSVNRTCLFGRGRCRRLGNSLRRTDYKIGLEK